MGSVEADLDKSQLNVLITGFGPFKKDYPINPSWEIAKDLPEYLPAVRAKSKGASAGPKLPVVRLFVHPEPVHVGYQAVRELVPKLWHLDDLSETKPRIDLVIHIGMAGPDPMWQIERRGHRDGYAMKDVDGEFLRDQERRRKEGKDWIWDGVPAELETDLDLDDVLQRWKRHSPDNLDLRISEDPGRYLCDFIYFSSLAHLYKAKEKRRVVFLHVPSEPDKQHINTGRELLIQLIRSIVESEVSRRGRGGVIRN